jgi:protein gp37
MRRKILVADLLCGAGGSTTGCFAALLALGYTLEEIILVCVNHWPVADGGESGSKARFTSYDNFRLLRDQCAAAGVAYFHKQNGEFSEDGRRVGKKAAGRLLDGEEWNEFPNAAAP